MFNKIKLFVKNLFSWKGVNYTYTVSEIKNNKAFVTLTLYSKGNVLSIEPTIDEFIIGYLNKISNIDNEVEFNFNGKNYKADVKHNSTGILTNDKVLVSLELNFRDNIIIPNLDTILNYRYIKLTEYDDGVIALFIP